MVSVTGISSGVHTASSPVVAGIGEHLQHPVRLGADESDLHQPVDRLGGGQLADDVPGGLGVDHHQVPPAVADLEAQLPDR